MAPLTGITILDLTHVLAGPLSAPGAMDLRARARNVERPRPGPGTPPPPWPAGPRQPA